VSLIQLVWTMHNNMEGMGFKSWTQQKKNRKNQSIHCLFFLLKNQSIHRQIVKYLRNYIYNDL